MPHSITSLTVKILMFLFFIVLHMDAIAEGIKDSPDETITGQVRVLVADDNHHTSVHYFLDTKNYTKQIEIKFANDKKTVLPHLLSGQKIKVHGKMIADKNSHLLLVSPLKNTENLQILSTEKNQQNADITTRNMAAIIVDLDDASASANYSIATIDKNLQAAKLAYQTASYNILNFNLDGNGDGKTDIYGPFKVNYSKSICSPVEWGIAADELAQAAGINLSRYQNIIYILPPKSQLPCAFFELADLGGIPARIWTVGADQPGTYFHGLAHNFGLLHSSLDPEDDGIIKYEYADASDVMGPGPMGFFNGPHAAQTNWLGQYPNAIQTITASGIYDLYPMSANPALIQKPQILKIKKPNSPFTYFLSYRQPEGADKSIPLEFTKGVNIHTQMTEFDSTYGYDLHSLYVKTLSDNEYYPANHIRITQMPRNGDNSHVSVRVQFGICNRANPTILLSPTLMAAQPGKRIAIKINLKNNDMAGCSPNYFRLFPLLPPGFTGSISPLPLVELKPGQEQTFNYYISTSTATNPDDYSIGIIARDILSTPYHSEVIAKSHLQLNTDGALNISPGITYKIYDGVWDSMPDFNKLKPSAIGISKNFDISARQGAKYYAYMFDGYIYVNKDGKYRFYTASDDGSMLYINDRLVVNNDGLHQRLERGGYIDLFAGWNHIRVDYLQKTGSATLSVYYSGPELNKQLIGEGQVWTTDRAARSQ